MKRTGRSIGAALTASVVGASLLVVGVAVAEEVTRTDYVARLEAICKPGSKATQRVMRGARDDVRKERNAVAAHKFERAAKIFGHTVSTIARVPRPAADAGRLKTWFVYLSRQEDYMQQIAEQLRAGRTIKAQRLLSRFIHNGNLANNVTLAFGFDYCSFKFSRFG
jgi:carbohydrate-selective porin OprB